MKRLLLTLFALPTLAHAQTEMVSYTDGWFGWSADVPSGDGWVQQGPSIPHGEDPKDAHALTTTWVSTTDGVRNWHMALTVVDWRDHASEPETLDNIIQFSRKRIANPSPENTGRTLDYGKIDLPHQTYTYRSTMTLDLSRGREVSVDYFRAMRFGNCEVSVEFDYGKDSAAEARGILDKFITSFSAGPGLSPLRYREPQ